MRAGVAGPKIVAAALFASCVVGAVPAGSLGDALPYDPSAKLPAPVSSPPVDPTAPYTPTVVKLLKQLEPAQPDPVHDQAPAPGTTVDQLLNADNLLHGGGGCTTVGANLAPTGTDPAIAPLCWADGMGINTLKGAQLRQTSATPVRIGLASSWDPGAENAWGQVEGAEGRALGVTGLYGPQVDLLRIPAWGRNLAISGEDPFLDGVMGSNEVSGVQGKGLMSQAKHFAFYNGQNMALDTQVQDQAAHELYLTPYEYAASGSGELPDPGQASSLMCSYQNYEIVAAPGVTGAPAGALGPTGGDWSCNHDLMNRVAHQEWGWKGFFATDYLFELSRVDSITKGLDQEMPLQARFGPPLVAAVMAHQIPLSTFNASVARILYEEERFHLLGHADADSDYLSPSSPTDTDGKGAAGDALKVHDSAIVEKGAEEGSVLLKDDHATLPLSAADLRKGVAVVGQAAEYMPAGPGIEASKGWVDRDAISPLEQLEALAPGGSHVTFVPVAEDAAPTAGDGQAVPKSALSTDGTTTGNGLMRTSGPGSPSVDPDLDFTSVGSRGQLAFGQTYTWTGYVDAPAADHYTFRFQFSVPGYTMMPGQTNDGGAIAPPSCSGSGAPSFSLASDAGVGQPMSQQSLSSAGATTAGIPTNPTMSGYTERGLANCLYDAGQLSAGVHQIQITWSTPAAFEPDTFHVREPGSSAPSLRFAYSRTKGDAADAAAAARSASKVVVFADCNCPGELGGGDSQPVQSLDVGTAGLITSMASANPRAAVVTNVDVAVLMPWLDKVDAVLNTWYPGSEGGTATARLLLGAANPSGHLTSTWPQHSTDTLSGYDEKAPLYPGDTTGAHGDRLASTPPVKFSEGIFVGYRFFDRAGITPLFPFGWGLSYTTFRVGSPRTVASGDGYDVSFDVKNTGSVAGAAVPQVYLGPAPSVPAGVQQADRALAGFDRVDLKPGQTSHETIHIGPGSAKDGRGNVRAFQYWSTPKQAWVTAPGPRSVWVGLADDPALLRQAVAGLLSSGRGCVSRRRFRIRLRAPHGERLVSARVYVNGHRTKVLRGRRLRASVDLRGLPKGRFTVKVVARTRKGRRVVETRRYRTCAPR